MKRNAFTVAEILIALMTIGVLAALVMPTLFYNTQKTMFKNARKVQRERISQGISMMSMRVNRFSYGRSDAFLNDLQRFMRISKVCSDNNIADCWSYQITLDNGRKYNMSEAKKSSVFSHNNVDPDGNDAHYTEDNAVFVTDTGIPVLFNFNTSCTPNSANFNRDCYMALLDVNGENRPNELGKDILLINAKEFAGVEFTDKCNSNTVFIGSGSVVESSGNAGAKVCVGGLWDDDDWNDEDDDGTDIAENSGNVSSPYGRYGSASYGYDSVEAY